MKKILNFWWIVLILIPIIFTGSMLLKAKNTENNRKISQEYASKLVIPPDGNYNKNNIEDIKERVGMIHPRYLKAIFDKSIFIRTVSGPITSIPEFKIYKNLSDNISFFENYDGYFMGNFIIIRIDDRYGPGLGIHEVAHAVDNVLFKLTSSSDEFKNIFNKEGANLFNKRGQEYYLQSSLEYFAEAFNWYYYGYDTREYLKDRAPETYKFIKDLESRDFK